MKPHGIFALFLVMICGVNSNAQEPAINLDIKNLKQVAEVDKRYQSFNIEMCEVVGGDFWIPYDLLDPDKVRSGGFAALKRGIPPIDLSEKKLRMLASALGPTYVRVSGTWANTTYFQDNDQPKLDQAPEGYENVLTRKEWKGVIDFCDAVDGKLVTSFAISDGIRDKEGNWTPDQIKPLINYTKSIGGEIVAAEMFNEPSFASRGGAPDGYDASTFARDFSAFKSFVQAAVPEMKILGPGSTGEGGLFPAEEAMSTDNLFAAVPKPEFDIFSYHFYGGASERCMGGLTPEDALTEEWLSKTELGLKYYENARDRYQPDATIWLTETAEAACGGDPWAATYVDCFRYLEQLGRLAKKGVQVVMHNTLAASEYALLEQDTHDPRPNYWAALLWNRLMGTKVYDAGISGEGTDIFVHSLKNRPGGLAVLIVNPGEDWRSVNIPVTAEQYLLTADELLTKRVKLNGKVLQLTADDMLPVINGKTISPGEVRLPPHSILFLAIPDISGSMAENPGHMASRDQLFNDGWKFIRDSIVGAELPGFDDSNWMVVDLPHDYSMMDLPGGNGPDQIGPFSKKSPGKGHSTGHVIGGTGWYRKSFTLDEAEAGKTAIIKFDGVYMESEVWVNGKQAGVHKNGYTPFWFNITPLLNEPGKPNIIAVKVDNTGRNSRWYSGSGIYRNVHLTLTPPVHVAVWGVHVATPEITRNSATVDVEVTAQNESDREANAVIEIAIKDRDGNTVATVNDQFLISGGATGSIKKQVAVPDPALWSPESPDLYDAEIRLVVDNNAADEYHQAFGIRSIAFSSDDGFLLNGRPMLLKGGCMHSDNGLLGSAAFNRVEQRKVETMKVSGFNAIRCAHNPPSEAFLDACDRQGILVIDEFTDMWEAYKNPQDYARFFRVWWEKDLTDMILRDRNHPSVIMWSIGNEVLEECDTSGIRIARQLTAKVKSLDDTRAVTEAINDFFTPGGWQNTGAAFEVLDVGGYQYNWAQYEPDHQDYPGRIMFGSESYPLEAYDTWKKVENLSYVIGDFVWTSADYLGEVFIGGANYVPANTRTIMQMPEGFQLPPGINVFDLLANMPSSWPDFGASCGDIDITGEKKPQSLYRDVLWDNSELEICVHEPIPEGLTENVDRWGWPAEWPHWNWHGCEGTPLQVRVFTRAAKVKLELNGTTVGEKELSEKDKYIAVFEVPYQAGELKAITLENDVETASKTLRTTGAPFGIKLHIDRSELKADRNDLGFVTIELIDANGKTVPLDSVKINLTLSGNGELIASGNASLTDMESVNKPTISSYKGKAQAVIRPLSSPGEILLKAESDGLEDAEILIRTK